MSFRFLPYEPSGALDASTTHLTFERQRSKRLFQTHNGTHDDRTADWCGSSNHVWGVVVINWYLLHNMEHLQKAKIQKGPLSSIVVGCMFDGSDKFSWLVYGPYSASEGIKSEVVIFGRHSKLYCPGILHPGWRWFHGVQRMPKHILFDDDSIQDTQ